MALVNQTARALDYFWSDFGFCQDCKQDFGLFLVVVCAKLRLGGVRAVTCADLMPMKRQRSTAYPVLTLSSAYRVLRENLQGMEAVALNREDLAKRLGYKTAQGGLAARKIGGLALYGCLERQGGLYSLSPLGLRLQELEPSDADFPTAIGTAFKSPVLFAKLMERFREVGRLPADLSLDLASLGIQEGALAEAEVVFRKSALFARVILLDGTFREPTAQAADRSLGQPKVKEQWKDFDLMLTTEKFARLRVPRSMRPRDLILLRRALDVVLEGLPEHLGFEATSEESKSNRPQEKKSPVWLVPSKV